MRKIYYNKCTFFRKELQLIYIVLKSQKRYKETETDFSATGVRCQSVIARFKTNLLVNI